MTKAVVVAAETEETKFIEQANTSKGAAERLVVVDQQSYEVGRELIRGDKELVAAVKEYWEPIKTSAHTVHKGICEREKANLAPINEAVNLVKGKMIQYDKEEEAKRRVEQERLEKEAAAAHQRRMTTARTGVEKLKGQTKDIQGQINILNAELNDCLASDTASEESVQVLEAEISVLEMSLKSKADAAALRERQAREADEAAAATPAPSTPGHEKVTGVSRPVTYKVEIVDFKALIKAIARGDVPFNPEKPLFTPSKTALKALATAGTLKPGVSHGCRVTKDTGLSIR